MLTAGDATGDVTEAHIRRIQIRETIKAHLEKEKQLFPQGIKVLSLFFIDEVVEVPRLHAGGRERRVCPRYSRRNTSSTEREFCGRWRWTMTPTASYLDGHRTRKTHNGYFSIDKKTKRLVDPDARRRGTMRSSPTTWMPMT